MYGCMECGFGQVTASSPKPPFWQLPTREDRVSTAMKAVQKVLSLTQTGVWDKATHDAVFGWYAANHPGTAVPEWGETPEATSLLAVEVLDEIGENPVLGDTLESALGIPSAAQITANPHVLEGKDRAAGEITTHIAAQEGAAAITKGGAAAGLSTTSLLLIIGGVLLFGGIFGYGLAATTKPKVEPAALPAT